MKRYKYISNGSSYYIYDNVKRKLYIVNDDNTSCSELSISLEQLGRFCPYSSVLRESNNMDFKVIQKS